MALSLMVLHLGALLFAAVKSAVASELSAALDADDACEHAEGCSLHLLQRRGHPRLAGACSKVGAGCLHTRCCADAGYQCYAKNRYWADCRTSCVQGLHAEDPPKDRTPWLCFLLSPPTTTSTTTTSTTTSTIISLLPHGPHCSKAGDDCRTTGCCSEAGMKCFEKNNYWASCRQNCTPGQVDVGDPEPNATWTCARYIYNNRVPAPKEPFELNMTGNPFEGHPFYVNPKFKADVMATAAQAPNASVRSKLEAMATAPTALWVDRRSKISGIGPNTMEGALALAASKSPPELVTFILYNLPNRDCSANASLGELCCNAECNFSAAGDCLHGLSQYVTEFIDPIVALLQRYEDLVPSVLVLEPDSLANLVTNSEEPRCGSSSTRASYVHGIRYAVRALSRISNVAIYLDAGNSGWLGWTSELSKYVTLVQEIGETDQLRGFASNIANYNPLGVMCPTYDWCLSEGNRSDDACCADPCDRLEDYNPAVNELNYALHLVTAMSEAIPGFSPRVIIDTGRNGAGMAEKACHSWCNLRSAGAGHTPTSHTANPEVVDAYFWLKTPGESDGCTEFLPNGTKCPRFDEHCNSSSSIGTRPGESGAPEAGQWFDLLVAVLAANSQLA